MNSHAGKLLVYNGYVYGIVFSLKKHHGSYFSLMSGTIWPDFIDYAAKTRFEIVR